MQRALEVAIDENVKHNMLCAFYGSGELRSVTISNAPPSIASTIFALEVVPREDASGVGGKKGSLASQCKKTHLFRSKERAIELEQGSLL
jgi:hypothetical protein